MARIVMKIGETAQGVSPIPPGLGLGVMINNRNPVVVGSPFAGHGDTVHAAPLAIKILGSRVFVNGLEVLGQGDGISCGKLFDACFGTVFIGEG